MSLLASLRPLIDKRVRDYVQAFFDETPPRVPAQVTAQAKELAELKARLAATEADLRETKLTLDKLRYEDRLTLTRARLIRALNELETP